MAELASPESWCTGNGTVGSNPTPSAGWASTSSQTARISPVRNPASSTMREVAQLVLARKPHFPFTPTAEARIA